MSILSELKTVAAELNIPVETGAYTSAAPDCFLVMTPIMDSFPLSADDKPVSEVNEVRLSLYSRDNYSANSNKPYKIPYPFGFCNYGQTLRGI